MLKNYFLIACKVYMRRKLFTAINLLCIILTLVVLLTVTAIMQNSFFPGGVEGRSDRYLQVDTLTQLGKDNNVMQSPLGYKIIDQYLRKMKSATVVAGVTAPAIVSVYQVDRVEKLEMRYADAEYWEILDFKILAGRVPSKDDVTQGRFVAVLNGSTAKKLFDTQSAIGKKINIRNQQFEIIGVVADSSSTNAYADIWAPVTTLPSSEYKSRIDGNFTALLLASDTSGIFPMRLEVQEIAKQIKSDQPEQWHTVVLVANSKLDSFARTFASGSPQVDSGAATVLMWVAILMILFMLLPALNLVNLNMGRMLERSAEIGVRKAFGASRTQLVLQFLMENVLISLVGCVFALLCAQGFLLWLNQSGVIPYLAIGIDWTVFFYGLIITIIFGLISGVLPAWKMSRLDPVTALKGNA